MRFRPLTAVLLVALLALAGCLPTDGAPGSPGVPVLGVSRLSAEQLVAYYRSHAPAFTALRATSSGPPGTQRVPLGSSVYEWFSA